MKNVSILIEKNFNEFIGVMVNKAITVSSVRGNKTSSAHHAGRSPPKVRSLSVSIPLPFALFHLPTPPLIFIA